MATWVTITVTVIKTAPIDAEKQPHGQAKTSRNGKTLTKWKSGVKTLSRSEIAPNRGGKEDGDE